MNANFKAHQLASAVHPSLAATGHEAQSFARAVTARLEQHGLEVVPTGTERALARCMEVLLRRDMTDEGKLQWIRRICEAHAPHPGSGLPNGG
jgi:hypothetical protein